MSAPILWIAVPIAVSVALFISREKRIRIILFISANILLALIPVIVLIDPIGEPAFYQVEMSASFNVLGRSFVLEQEDLFLVQLIYFFNALWGVFIYFYNQNSRVIPFGMAFSALLLAAYSVTPFLYSALIIEVAVIISIPILADRNSTSLRGVMRFLIFQSLALPFILLSGWFLAGGEITPVNQDQLVQATMLLGLGFVLWLGIFPFHSWLSMMFDSSDSVNAGYILQILLVVLLLLVLKFIDGFPWLREYTLFSNAVVLLGIIMTVIGAIGFFFERKIRKISGYFLIHALGNILIAIGIFRDADIYLFSSLVASFLISVSLFSIAAEDLHTIRQTIELTKIIEIDKIIPVVSIIFASLTLAGMPLTLGFPPNQALYQTLAGTKNTYFIILFASKIVITFSVFRWITALMKKRIPLSAVTPDNAREWILAGLLILIMITGIFPQVVFTNFRNLVIGFENLIQ